MPAESTFDIVSEFDRQELVNAVDQAQREVNTRHDLKDSKTEIALGEKDLTITTDSEMRLRRRARYRPDQGAAARPVAEDL